MNSSIEAKTDIENRILLLLVENGGEMTLMKISSNFDGVSTMYLGGALMCLELEGKIKQLPYERDLGTVLGRRFKIV